MPDFHVIVSEATGTPGTAQEVRLWTDPASGDRPSRITPVNDRQHRFLRAQIGATVRLNAIRTGQAPPPEDDSVVGLFTSWAVEHPSAVVPVKTYPIPGTSAVVDWLLPGVGHYLLAMRHEDTQDAPEAAAGGAVFIHIDVTGA